MSRTPYYDMTETEPELIKIGRLFSITLDTPGIPTKVKNEKILRKYVPYYWAGCYMGYKVSVYAFPEEPNKWYHRYYEQGQ